MGKIQTRKLPHETEEMCDHEEVEVEEFPYNPPPLARAPPCGSADIYCWVVLEEAGMKVVVWYQKGEACCWLCERFAEVVWNKKQFSVITLSMEHENNEHENNQHENMEECRVAVLCYTHLLIGFLCQLALGGSR